MTKKCKLCDKEMELELFEKDKRTPDGHSSRCLDCARECKRISALKHRDERLERQRKYREEHPEEYKAEKHAEYERNNETYKKNRKAYYEENKEWFIQMTNECRNRRYEKDPTKAIADKLRAKVRGALLGICCSKETEDMLGSSRQEFCDYMESLFEENMNWDNYGYKGWGTDHRKPLCKYDLTDPIQVYISFNFRNLQPMWVQENMNKYTTWTDKDEHNWRQNIWPYIKADLMSRGIIDSSYEGC